MMLARTVSSFGTCFTASAFFDRQIQIGGMKNLEIFAFAGLHADGSESASRMLP